MQVVYDTTGARACSGETAEGSPKGEMSGSERVNCSLIAEYLTGSSTSPLRAYVHGPMIDELLAMISGSGTVYYHHDALGSTTALTDATGTLVESYTYDAFGTPSIFDGSLSVLSASSVVNRFLFTGREFFQEVAIYDYRNRAYHATLGRFFQTDPISFDAGDVNLYRYVGNNPVNKIDPTGTVSCDCPSGRIFCGVGAALACSPLAEVPVAYAICFVLVYEACCAIGN